MKHRKGTRFVYTVVLALFVLLALPVFGQDTPEQTIRTLLEAGRQEIARNNIPSAEEQFNRALEKAREQSLPTLQAEAHLALGDLYFNHTDSTKFVKHYQQARDLDREGNLQDWGLKIRIMIREGILADTEKNYQKAQGLYWQAMMTADRTWKPSVAGKAVNSFIGSLTASGASRSTVLSSITRFERICRDIGYPTAYARLMLVRSAYMRQRMNQDDVADLLRNQAFDLLESITKDFLSLARETGPVNENLYLLRHATRYARVANNRSLEGITYLTRAETLLKNGNTELANRESRWSWQLLRETPRINLQLRLHRLKGNVHVSRSEPNRAFDTFLTGFQLAHARNRLEWMNRFRNLMQNLERSQNPSFTRDIRTQTLDEHIRDSLHELSERAEELSAAKRRRILSVASRLDLPDSLLSNLKWQETVTSAIKTFSLQSSKEEIDLPETTGEPGSLLKEFLTKQSYLSNPITPDAFITLWKQSDAEQRWMLATRDLFRPGEFLSPSRVTAVLKAVKPGSPLQSFLLGRVLGTDLPADTLQACVAPLLESKKEKTEQEGTDLPLVLCLYRWKDLQKFLTRVTNQRYGDRKEKPYPYDLITNRSSRSRFLRTVVSWKKLSEPEKQLASLAGLASKVTIPSELFLQSKVRRKQHLTVHLAFLAGLNMETEYPARPSFTGGWYRSDKQKYLARLAGLYRPTPEEIHSLEPRTGSSPFALLLLETSIEDAAGSTAFQKILSLLEQPDTKNQSSILYRTWLAASILANFGARPAELLSNQSGRSNREKSADLFVRAMKTVGQYRFLNRFHPFRNDRYIFDRRGNRSIVYRISPQFEYRDDGSTTLTLSVRKILPSETTTAEPELERLITADKLSLSYLTARGNPELPEPTPGKNGPELRIPPVVEDSCELTVRMPSGVFPETLNFYVKFNE